MEQKNTASAEAYSSALSAVCRTAVLMDCEGDLIARVELFYDAGPFGNL